MNSVQRYEKNSIGIYVSKEKCDTTAIFTEERVALAEYQVEVCLIGLPLSRLFPYGLAVVNGQVKAHSDGC